MQACAYLGRANRHQVLIHINNLENLSAQDIDHAAMLFQSLRDDFLIPHNHWIFVGATGIESRIFRRTTQQSMDRLIEASVILLDRTEGRSTYYRLIGDASIAFRIMNGVRSS